MATIKALGSIKTPRYFQTIPQKLANGIWPWTDGIRSRLPLHYKLGYIEKHQSDPAPVHYKPNPDKYKITNLGQKTDVMNVPFPIIYPAEADNGLWGGEGFILGMRKKHDKNKKPRVYRLWKPFLTKRVVYCEILDKWLQVTVTFRTLNLIDEVHGFDHYILGTPEIDLRSKLGMKLKRKLLFAVLHKNMYQNDPIKREEIYEKYKKHLIPEEEIEWLGLTIEEAERKLEDIEEDQYLASKRPLKNVCMEELIEKMKNNKLDDEEMEDTKREGSWLDKLNPFTGK